MKRIVFAVSLAILAGCNQNVTTVGTGERLEDAPPVTADPNPRPLPAAEPPMAGGGAPGMRREGVTGEVPPFLKVFFMHKFVEALYSVPQNPNPNPRWQSPLKDAENGRVWCTDCHSSDLNFANMPKQRMPQHDELEKNHEFMVELMTKWVARLNSDEFRAKAKLKQPVQCLTCHETDPRKR